MAKRFGKEGSVGMRGPTRGPLWAAFCYLSSEPRPFGIHPQSQTERWAKNSRGRRRRGPHSLPLISLI